MPDDSGTSFDPRFDPRFDPAFQRGYSQDDSASTTAPGPSAEPREDGRPDEVDVRHRPSEPIVDDVTVSTSETDVEPTAPGVNGYLVALIAIAAALVAAGAWLFGVMRTSFDDPSAFRAESDYFVLQSVIILAPLSVMLGLATGIAVLFVYAVRRSRS